MNSLKSRFISFSVLLIVVSVGFPTYFLLQQFKENFRQRSEIMMETTLKVVSSGINSMMLSGQDKDIQSVVDRLSKTPNIRHIRIYDSTGTIQYATNPVERGKNIFKIDPNHKQLGITPAFFKQAKNSNNYTTAQPIFNTPRCQKCHDRNRKSIAYLDIDTDLTEAEDNFFTGYQHTLFLAIFTIVILVVGFYYLFYRFVEHPLRKFSTALSEVEGDNFNVLMPEGQTKELQPIEKHFNGMVTHLKESRRRIEDLHFEQLQRADRLVTLGELAAEMAHEINNPLGIAMSRVDFLRLEAEEHSRLLPYYQDLQVILSQIEKISSITGNILKYSKKYPKNFRNLNIVSLIEESVKIVLPRLNKKGIEFEQIYTCKQDCQNAWIQGDPQQIEQIIINLIQNALDSMGKNGKITTEVICLPADQIEIKITDTGKGMSSDIRQQIFLPFFTTKPPEKGTGLGLYIVKKICENHGGTIACNSIPGVGTTFSIIFNRSAV